jgi:hypothetical protein
LLATGSSLANDDRTASSRPKVQRNAETRTRVTK